MKKFELTELQLKTIVKEAFIMGKTFQNHEWSIPNDIIDNIVKEARRFGFKESNKTPHIVNKKYGLFNIILKNE